MGKVIDFLKEKNKRLVAKILDIQVRNLDKGDKMTEKEALKRILERAKKLDWSKDKDD